MTVPFGNLFETSEIAARRLDDRREPFTHEVALF